MTAKAKRQTKRTKAEDRAYCAGHNAATFDTLVYAARLTAGEFLRALNSEATPAAVNRAVHLIQPIVGYLQGVSWQAMTPEERAAVDSARG